MNSTFKVVFNKARGALMVVNEATSSVQAKGTKTVVAAAVATLAAGAMMSAPALADETNETPAHVWNLKTEGFQEFTNDATPKVYRIRLIGGDFKNHAQDSNGTNFTNNSKERYGDHRDAYVADITGSTELNLDGSILDQHVSEFTTDSYDQDPASIDILGGSLIYGSIGTDPAANSANISGDVKINVSDYVKGTSIKPN